MGDRKMRERKGIVSIIGVAVALVMASGMAYALEDIHPTGVEHPPAVMKKADVTKEELATAIKGYVKKEAALKGGYFLVYDRVDQKPLVLSLTKVHKERLSRVGPNTYFACADFTTPKGTVYDLDIFMKGHDKDNLSVTQITVHKKDGKERYTWHEKDGIWKMRPIMGAEGSAHKMEHPEGSSHKTEHPSEHPSEGSGHKSEHPTEHPH